MSEIKHILVTNDDGVFAPGLLALAQEMRKIAEVVIMAPDRNWSWRRTGSRGLLWRTRRGRVCIQGEHAAYEGALARAR